MNFKFSKSQEFTPTPERALATESPKNGARLAWGFTLVETITAMFVFSVATILIVGMFTKAVQAQRQSLNTQRVVESSLFALESIAKDIRVSSVCPGASVCPGWSGCSQTRIEIFHPIKSCMAYETNLANGVIRKTEGGITVDITSTDAKVSRFNFLTSGLGLDNKQPRVTIVSSIQSRLNQDVVFDVQTTVVSRDVAEEFQN